MPPTEVIQIDWLDGEDKCPPWPHCHLYRRRLEMPDGWCWTIARHHPGGWW